MPTRNIKRTYIGGTTYDARKKYLNWDKELTQITTNLAASYGISPALVIDRLAHEGLVDRLIKDNNEYLSHNGDPNYPSNAFDMDDYNEPYGLLGLDNIFDTYTKGITKTKRPINMIRQVNRNERGEFVNSGETKNLYDTLELFVAELASRRNQVRKQYPNLTDAELDSATSARYNASNKYFKQLMDSGEYKTKYPINVKDINIPAPTKTDSKYIQDQVQSINKSDVLNAFEDYHYFGNDLIDESIFTVRNKSYNPGLFMNEENYEFDSDSPLVDRFIDNYVNRNFTHPNKVQVVQEYKCGGRRKAQLGLDIREGGIAIPIAPNMYYMDGRSHNEGGIGIGPNNKNGLEVEGGEVVKVGKNDVKVFSSVPLLRGVSPAQLVMGGANPDTVFKAQENFKDRNRINDDGTRYEVGGEKRIYTPSKSIQRQIQETGRITIGGSPTIGGLRTAKYVRGLANAKSYAKQANKIFTKVDNLVNNGLQGLINKHKITPNQADAYKKFYNEIVGVNGVNIPKTVSLFVNNENKEMRYGGRTKAEIGTYQPKRNNKGQIVLNPNNPDDVKWLHEQQGKRGTKAVHKGQQEFLEGALNRTTPLMLGIAAANPITTATSLAGGYLLGEVGELGGELYKGLTGEDYTREGKVIGQTIGGLGGPIGAKLFGKGATNAWNAYKSNRLNSTQTLVDIPETGLTVRPNVRTNRPKQLEVTNNQKYLPTDVEDLTWKEPKALLETQAQVTRRDLKNFNRWAKLFGYEPVPLRYAETKSIADRHVQDRIRQHNTFLRGVAKPNALQRQAIEYELAKEGITNPTDYDVYNYMATHSAPTTGAGRADLRPIQVRKRKVGNFNLSKTSDSPIGALYTQGSGRGAAGYAGLGPMSGGHRRTGVVVEVARPTNFRPGASYAEWVKENDFNFGDVKSKGFHKKVANRVVETGKAPEAYNLPAEDKQILFNQIKNEFATEPKPVYETAKHALDYIKTHRPNILKNITQLDESAFNSLSNDSKRAYNKYLGKLMILNPKTVSFSKEVKKENDRFKNTFRTAVTLEDKRHKNKYLSDIDYNPEDYTQPDYSVLKSTSRNRGNAQQHYIFRAPIGEKILEGRGFYLPTEEEIINATTDHYSLWTPGYSRNTRKFGGIKKFKFGGNMIYTINGNIRNGLMSARPKATLGTKKEDEEKKKKNPNETRYASLVKKSQSQEVTPKPVVTYNETADKNPDKYRYTRAAGFKNGVKTSSTGGGIQSKDGRWVGQYKTTNIGDWIGLGSNLAGTITSYFMTKNAINKMPEPLKPVMTSAVKLKTKYNIQPQLTNISEAEQMNRASVRRNTQSSNTSLAREQRLMNEARGSRNTLYGQKENIETQLINQDRLNRQSVMRDNVRAYNEYLNKVTATKMAQNEMRASNINNLISGLTGSVNSILGNIESRRATNNTLRAIAAANPNVDARLIGGFDYYIDPITKKKYNKNQQYVGTING